MQNSGFLPISKEDMAERGWNELDFILISGEAYVDHPSFGMAIISRLLEHEGYRVGIIALPNWKDTADFKALGRPRLAFLISSGVIDSMVNHYTASKKIRSEDAYAPGGQAGLRPDRAVIVYANRVREAYKNIPVIIGGIEASLRRFAHYDYWDDAVRRSILVDSRADILVYGMGEKPIVEIAAKLSSGAAVTEITDIRGTAFLGSISQQNLQESGPDQIVIPSFDEVKTDKRKYAQAFLVQYQEQDPIRGKTILQLHGDRYLVQNPPALPLIEREMDQVYALPYQRTYHPIYEAAGGIPAIREVEFSITSHRGCFGGCSFCALNFHQGRIIQKRSQSSIINEAKKLVWLENFKGYIHD
ncbi:MAG TPA: YgiQ family radical SAM protein, partial [Firmicutes bacterium]|nr:YgiQ family radical SAM protein [Bacillota bacterium]